VVLDDIENIAAVITGPNMAGKSTYMRQVALIVLMAQMGGYVPATSAEIGIVDSIFTRIGASDDLASGQSTFMVEMNEVAYIIENATPNSLIILDEIGRGTSTFDGMSIAKAVLEYLTDKQKLGAKTLFATHYHELTSMSETHSGIKNYNTAVKKKGDDITFLRRIVPGGADDSYGIEVAKLSGIPDWIINRAKEVLSELENSGKLLSYEGEKKKIQTPQESNLKNKMGERILDKIKNLDVSIITPLEAMNLLNELVSECRKIGGIPN
jgi:DNA mismatch repair protein MutS